MSLLDENVGCIILREFNLFSREFNLDRSDDDIKKINDRF